MILNITLGNGVSTRSILFQVHDTNIAFKWAEEIKKGYPLFETKRFTGWPGGLSKNDYVNLINESIDIINQYQNVINDRAYNDMPIAHTNTLHKYFEIYRGGVLTPSDFYTNAPDSVKDALEKYNVHIHALEKIQNQSFLSPTITCTFESPRFELADEDYQFFTYDWKFGTVYINYCEVGKHLLEYFIDNDEVVGDDNIRPLKYYKADFKLKFTTLSPTIEYNKFTDRLNTWLVENRDKFDAMGILPERYALGLIPVATIIETTDMYELIDELKMFNYVESVRILN